jgi:hypothetical protein
MLVLSAFEKELLRSTFENVVAFSNVFLVELLEVERNNCSDGVLTLKGMHSVRTSLALKSAAIKSGIFEGALAKISFNQIEEFSSSLPFELGYSAQRDGPKLQNLTGNDVAKALIETARRRKAWS